MGLVPSRGHDILGVDRSRQRQDVSITEEFEGVESYEIECGIMFSCTSLRRRSGQF